MEEAANDVCEPLLETSATSTKQTGAWSRQRSAAWIAAGLCVTVLAGSFALWLASNHARPGLYIQVEEGLETRCREATSYVGLNGPPPVDPCRISECFEKYGKKVIDRFERYGHGWAVNFMIGNQTDARKHVMYYPVPKAMSGTMRVFMGYFGLRNRNGEQYQFGHGMNIHDRAPTENLTKEERSYFTFTMVRDPVKRQLDGLLQKSLPDYTFDELVDDQNLLNEYVYRFCNDDLDQNSNIHLAPALFLLFQFGSRRMDTFVPPDFIGKVEQAPEHFDLLLDELKHRSLFSPNVSLEEVSDHTPGNVNRTYDMLTAESIECLCHKLCYDYLCLEYEMPPECANISCD